MREVAQEMGLNEFTIYRLVERGKLPHARVGGSIRIHKLTLETFMLAQELSYAERGGQA